MSTTTTRWNYFQGSLKTLILIIGSWIQSVCAENNPLIKISQKAIELSNTNLSQNESNFTIPEYQFRDGKKLLNLNIHYSTLGTPRYDEKGEISNAVLFLHWTGASGAALLTPIFKEVLYSAGQPLDANKYFLIFPDSIGNGKSSKPSDGLRMNFPNYGYHDMVNLQYRLVTEHLRISHLKMILGTSMGGMNTWLWSVLYPDFMDGIMPIVSLPSKVEGQNLLWRQMIVQTIQNDPEWKNGNYTQQPYSLKSTLIFARMLLDGVPHLQKIVPDIKAAISFIHEATDEAEKKDANDLMYVLNASRDYDPEPDLEKIQAKVFALDFTDDQLDPYGLNTLQTLIKRVKHGRATIQKGTPDSYGHLTMAHPNLWADQVKEFVRMLDSK